MEETKREMTKAEAMIFAMKKRRLFIKVYKKMCPKCKRLLFQDSKRPGTDYCLRCQEMASKVLGVPL